MASWLPRGALKRTVDIQTLSEAGSVPSQHC
jgi:hypothetical protein